MSRNGADKAGKRKIQVTSAGEQLISMRQTCEKLNIARSTGWRWVKEGRLPPPTYLGGSWRLPMQKLSDVEKLIVEAPRTSPRK